jgi:hypothetical protein
VWNSEQVVMSSEQGVQTREIRPLPCEQKSTGAFAWVNAPVEYPLCVFAPLCLCVNAFPCLPQHLRHSLKRRPILHHRTGGGFIGTQIGRRRWHSHSPYTRRLADPRRQRVRRLRRGEQQRPHGSFIVGEGCRGLRRGCACGFVQVEP